MAAPVQFSPPPPTLAAPHPRVVIIGSGPTGLGAASRLNQLGHTNWVLLESSKELGGLARTVRDDKGFLWDMGGHVIFSHYRYFDTLLDAAVKDWLSHQRESWVWVKGGWVPYPFQNNIHRLPEEHMLRCLNGLISVKSKPVSAEKPKTFQEWIDRNFGAGIADIFLNPYNYKVWGYHPVKMAAQWMGERVPAVDLARITQNIIKKEDEVGWGPNATFRFPLHGGSGAIWKSIAEMLPQDKMRNSTEVASVDIDAKKVVLTTGEEVPYDYLISTMPLDLMLQKTPAGSSVADLVPLSEQFVYSSTHVIGIGLSGVPPPHLKTMCWMYFPEGSSPFYRATVFSNYSPNNVPHPGEEWSLMLEVTESPDKQVPAVSADMIEACIQGCLASDLLADRGTIVSTFHIRLQRGYPTPFIGRDELLEKIQPRLMAKGVFSRGRFGGWKYEVGNQDHSLMQGVEAVDCVLFGAEEETYFYPDAVNVRPKTRTTRVFTQPAAAAAAAAPGQ